MWFTTYMKCVSVPGQSLPCFWGDLWWPHLSEQRRWTRPLRSRLSGCSPEQKTHKLTTIHPETNTVCVCVCVFVRWDTIWRARTQVSEPESPADLHSASCQEPKPADTQTSQCGVRASSASWTPLTTLYLIDDVDQSVACSYIWRGDGGCTNSGDLVEQRDNESTMSLCSVCCTEMRLKLHLIVRRKWKSCVEQRSHRGNAAEAG